LDDEANAEPATAGLIVVTPGEETASSPVTALTNGCSSCLQSLL
jgi:hypothetical protein